MPRNGTLLLYTLCFLLAFPGKIFAQRGLNPQGFAELDPKTTTLERIGDKLHIRIKESDGKVTEIVKDLIEIKPGTNFFHWTEDPGGIEWMRSGRYPIANLEPLKVPTEKLQSYGAGFYASRSPVDAAQFGNILTHFQVPTQPRSLLGRIEGTTPESFWVLKDTPLFFSGDNEAARNKVAQPTYELLKKAGIAGSQVTPTWYTFFDERALTGFSSIDGDTFLDALKNGQHYPGTAVEKFAEFPQNAPARAAVEAALKKRMEHASLNEMQEFMDLVDPYNSPSLDQAAKARVQALLPSMDTALPAENFAKFLIVADRMGEAAYFQQLLDAYLAKVPFPWGDDNFQAMIGQILPYTKNQEIQKLILNRIQNAIAGIQVTSPDAAKMLHQLRRLAANLSNPELEKSLHKKTEELLKGGKLGELHFDEWLATLTSEEKQDPEVISALAKALEADKSAEGIEKWDNPSFQQSLAALLKSAPQEDFKAAIRKGFLTAINADPGLQRIYYLLDKIDDPELNRQVVTHLMDLVDKATEKDARPLAQAFNGLSRIEKIDPEVLHQILSRVHAKGAPVDGNLEFNAVQGIYQLHVPPRGEETRKLARAYLAQLQERLEKIGANLDASSYSGYANSILQSLLIPNQKALAPFVKDADFGQSPAAGCAADFAGVQGK
jgi:hypothetical protein